MSIKIDAEQRLYVIPCRNGFTCLGFDVARKRVQEVAAWLKKPSLLPREKIGTAEAYAEYAGVMAVGEEHSRMTGTCCPVELSPQLVGLEGWRVEVTKHGQIRRFIVGKSCGWMPCHLEIAKANSSGGPAAAMHYDSVRKLERVHLAKN